MRHAISFFAISLAEEMLAIAALVLFVTTVPGQVRAEGAAPEITIESGSVAPMEPVTVHFRNMPGNSNDWITLVPEGTPDGKYKEWKWVRETEGTLAFRGVEEGLYEIRIHLKGTHGEPAARLEVSVEKVAASPPADRPDIPAYGENGQREGPNGFASGAPVPEDATLLAPTIRTNKNVYSGREMIEVSFSGANGTGDVIMIAPVGAPADHGFWYRLGRGETEGKREISWNFSGNFRGDILYNGEYEARLFLKDEPDFIAHQFRIQGDQERPDILDGVWKSDALCGRAEKTEISLFVTDLDETRYAALRLIDRAHGDEWITHNWYQLGNDGDHEGDFITPEPVYRSGSSPYKFRIFNKEGKDQIIIDHAVCRDLPMQRVEATQPGGVPGPFNGEWAGYVDACSYFSEFPYDVQFSFRELPTGVVLAKAKTPFDDLNIPPHPFFYGEYDAAGDRIMFLSTAGKFIPSAKGKKKKLLLEFVKDEGRMFGKAEWLFDRGICDYIELSPNGTVTAGDTSAEDATEPEEQTRQDDATESPAARAALSDADPADGQLKIASAWEGTATCAGEPARLMLDVQDAPAGRYAGSIEYSFGGVLSSGVLTQELVGEKVSDGSYRFAIDTRRRAPPRRVGAPTPGGFLLSADGDNAERLKATYHNEDCTEVVLSKRTADRLAQQVRGGDDPQGAFYAERRPRERCEAVSEWLSKKDREYPGTDFWHSSSGQNTRRLVLLFADDDFVPVFGRPYDALSREDTKQITAEVERLCRGDPISRELISDFRLVIHFFNIVGTNAGAVTGASVRSLIRETRRIRNLVDEVGRNLSETASFKEAVPVLTDLRDQVNAAAEFLWPQEMESIAQHLTNRLGKYAAVEADAHHEQIIAMQDHIAQLKAMTAVARGQTDYHDYLLEDDRRRIHEVVVQDQIAIVERTYGSELASLRALQPSLVALSQLSGLQADLTPVLSLLASEVTQKFTGEIEEKRQALFDTLASERIALLAQFTADREGIQKSKGWIEDFEEDFSAFEGTATYNRAMNRYVEMRSGILRDAVSHFEAALANGKSAQKNPDDLVREYLSSEGDGRLPISLQYLVMAEIAKHDSHRVQEDSTAETIAAEPAHQPSLSEFAQMQASDQMTAMQAAWSDVVHILARVFGSPTTVRCMIMSAELKPGEEPPSQFWRDFFARVEQRLRAADPHKDTLLRDALLEYVEKSACKAGGAAFNSARLALHKEEVAKKQADSRERQKEVQSRLEEIQARIRETKRRLLTGYLPDGREVHLSPSKGGGLVFEFEYTFADDGSPVPLEDFINFEWNPNNWGTLPNGRGVALYPFEPLYGVFVVRYEDTGEWVPDDITEGIKWDYDDSIIGMALPTILNKLGNAFESRDPEEIRAILRTREADFTNSDERIRRMGETLKTIDSLEQSIQDVLERTETSIDELQDQKDKAREMLDKTHEMLE